MDSSKIARQMIRRPSISVLTPSIVLWVFSGMGFSLLGYGDDGDKPKSQDLANPPDSTTYAIEMERCRAERPRHFTEDDSLGLTLLSGKSATDKLVRKGTLTLEGHDYVFYLPKLYPKYEKYSSYRIENTSDHGDNTFRNNSTLLSVDQNGDGALTDDENWFANLPIRLGDQMFTITSIAEDGSRIEIKYANLPLTGLVVGRKCPPFSYTTKDGQLITQDTYKGKAFLLDIWSVT